LCRNRLIFFRDKELVQKALGRVHVTGKLRDFLHSKRDLRRAPWARRRPRGSANPVFV
jgi:hypothetical protein